MKILLSIALLFVIINAHPYQDPIKVYGTITVKNSTEPLISAGVTLYKNNKRIAACASDFDGHYSMNIPADTGYILEISYSSKKEEIKNIGILESKRIDYQLEIPNHMDDIVVNYYPRKIEEDSTTF